MGCAVGTLKFAVFIFNFILVCLGFAMVLFGALDSPLPNELDDLKEYVTEVSLTSKVLIIAGMIIFVVAFFGCWGAVSDSSCMLFLYAVFLMILILVEAAVGVYVYIHRDTAKESVSKTLKNWLHEYEQQTNTKKIVDGIQIKLHCCGVDGPQDWRNIGQILPASCCRENKIGNCPDPYQEGCLERSIRLLKDVVKKYLWIFGGIIGVEVLTILFALIVRNSILNEERRSLA